MSDFASDPLNCGTCGNVCQTNELCVHNTCQVYYPSPSCTTCPCAACGTEDTCCQTDIVPNTPTTLCVHGKTCP
jgi:hypothetical protein